MPKTQVTQIAKDISLKYSIPVLEFFQKLLIGIEKRFLHPASGIRNDRQKESSIIECIRRN